MLDSKLQRLKDHFGITNPEDWSAVELAWVTSLDGIGHVTLEYLRLLLAARGLTLKNDRTPEYWQQHLKAARISHTLGNELISDDVDRGLICPFTILIDTAEQHPFTFQSFFGDADQQHRPLIISTESTALGRFPDSLGDYSLDCGLNRCHVERKSIQDAQSTILGWAKKGEDGGRRERFERELENLSNMEAGLVVVECSFADLIRLAPQTAYRSPQQNARTLFRSVLSYQQKYSVAWMFCDGRRLAEQYTFHWLRRWYENDAKVRKAEAKRLGQLVKGGRGKVGQGGAVTAMPAGASDFDVDISGDSGQAKLEADFAAL